LLTQSPVPSRFCGTGTSQRDVPTPPELPALLLQAVCPHTAWPPHLGSPRPWERRHPCRPSEKPSLSRRCLSQKCRFLLPASDNCDRRSPHPVPSQRQQNQKFADCLGTKSPRTALSSGEPHDSSRAWHRKCPGRTTGLLCGSTQPAAGRRVGFLGFEWGVGRMFVSAILPSALSVCRPLILSSIPAHQPPFASPCKPYALARHGRYAEGCRPRALTRRSPPSAAWPQSARS